MQPNFAHPILINLSYCWCTALETLEVHYMLQLYMLQSMQTCLHLGKSHADRSHCRQDLARLAFT